ncbi:Putative ABC transporter permease [Rubellimicrobium mesophilum DSM 19309]|uniref:Putative ABC transporter permease n=1 Tax=Rubellimicrobium mesophilum DSM 19309 TaxID=442562 RepID=A0A017HPH5_9RHOB|nr:ABC transporter permease [Rubellimicrobium mesophilum]EYD76220.1 Putative ABC transporter permease [Rubellimicrobium mesophilum DSM 19309]
MRSRLGAFYVAVLMLLLVLPLVVVGGVSLNGGQNLRFPPQDASFRWYGELFRAADWTGPLRNSLVIAAVAALIAVAVALPLALHAWGRGGALSRVLYTLGVAPFMLPPVITALGFLVFWVALGMYGQMAATILSHGIFLVTLPLVTTSLGLQGIDPALLEAARTMGATRGQVLRTVVLPLALPYIISGYAFAFVLSLNEYIIAYMVAGFTVETLPIKIFNSLRYGYSPIMGVVSVLFVGLAILVYGAIGIFGNLPRLLGAEQVREG